MSIKDKIGIEILALTMLLLSIMLVPAASAAVDKASVKNLSDSKVETYGIEGLTPQEVKEIEARASYIRSLPDTVQNAPYIGLVTADDSTKNCFGIYRQIISIRF